MAYPHKFVFCNGKEVTGVFNIGICDDEDAFINELTYNLKKYAAETGKEFCFFVYHDGIELLAEYRSDYDLIFMDIKEVSALLLGQPQFACPHQSFVVNMSFVKGVEGFELVMATGKRIPISQPKRKDFMMKLTDYWGDML